MKPAITFYAFLKDCNTRQGLGTPVLYQRIAAWLEFVDDPLKVLQVFRDAGKSTIIAHYIAWRLLCDPEFTCILISASEKVATRNASLVKKILETHPLCQKLVNSQDLWRSNSFVVQRKSVKLNRSVESITLNSDFTGLHSDLLIADDCETSKSVETADGRVNVRARASEFTELAKKILYVGTPHSSDSIYPELEKAGAACLRLPLYEDVDGVRVLAWPERFPDSEIDRRRNGKSSAMFESQYLLIPVNVNESLLPVDLRHSYDLEIEHADIPQSGGNDLHIAKLGGKRLIDLIGFWDPASGLAGRDDSVLAILAQDEDTNVYVHRVIVLPPVHSERGYDDQANMIVSTCKTIGVPRLMVEQQANQVLSNEIKKAGNKLGWRMDIRRVSNTSNKLIRIANALEPVMSAGRLFVHDQVVNDSPFIGQCRDFPSCVRKDHSKDDAIDSVASGIEHLTRLPTIWNMGGTDRISNLGSSNRVHTIVRHEHMSKSSNPNLDLAGNWR